MAVDGDGQVFVSVLERRSVMAVDERGEEEPNLTWTSRRCSISAFRIVGGLSVAALVVVAWQRFSSGHRFENFEGFEGRVDGSPSMPLMQKWLPIHQSEVLPYDQWVKAWHVKVGRLTDVVYHTYSNHPEFVKELNGMTTFLQWQLSHNCPKQVVGFDIVSHDAHHFKPLKGVTSPGQCQMICTETQDCNSWTWAKIGPWKYHCWRKSLKGMYRFAENLHTVAGRACDHQTRGYWWPHSDADLYNLPMNLLDKSKVMHWQGRTCAVEGSRHLCQSAMERSFLPWPLNQFQHHGQHVDCCAPVEMQQAAYCSSGTPVRTGKNCSGFEAADFECCPDGHVLRGTKRSEASTMHCVMLFRAWTDEQRLVELQHEQNAGIFACDSYALYSNQLLETQPGVVTRRIHSPMMCELGGQFITALNLGIFLAFYRQVILDQEFMSAAWVIKVDPDTVWSPSRLRPMLQDLEWGLSGDGIYLNNCKDGLHGPIEIFSSGAFFALGQNAKSCAFHLDGKECIEHCKGVWTQTKVCNGPCTEWWGEDIWADQCLWRFTEAKRVMIKTLLQEEHCKPHVPKWRSCDDPNTVAFHPFKSPEEYRKCLEEMNFHGLRSLDERWS